MFNFFYIGKNKNRKFIEKKEFESIISYDNEWDINQTKREIEKLIPKNITVKAKNDKQIKLITSIEEKFLTLYETNEK